MAIKVKGINVIDDGRQLDVIGVNTISNVKISSGIITAAVGVVTYYGDGRYLQNIGVGIQSGGVVIGSGFTTLNFIGAGNTFAVNGTTVDISIEGGGGGGEVSISTNTTDQAQYIPYATSFGSTTGLGATSLLVYNPNANRLGINTNSPTRTLQVEGEFLVSAGSATTNHIIEKAYEINNGTLSWESTAGQLLSVSNNLASGSLFNVTNLSGIPYVDVDAGGRIDLSPYDSGDVNVGGGVSLGGISLYSATGIVSATAFYGDVTATSLTLGGQTASTLGVGVATEGGLVGSGATILDFRGAGISAVTVSSGVATINVTAGGGASVSISTEAPTSPNDGDLWFDNSDGNSYIWYDSQSVWVVSQTYGY